MLRALLAVASTAAYNGTNSLALVDQGRIFGLLAHFCNPYKSMDGPGEEAFEDRGQSGQPSTSGMPFDTQDGPSLDMGGNDFQLLKRALLNERMAPEILQYKEDLVERVKSGLQRQEQELEAMESQKEMDMVRQVLAYERDRVRYLLKSYLRARLFKIQQFAGSILDSSELRSRLSSQERTFTQNFFVAAGRHFKTGVLDELPPHYQSLVKRYEAEQDKKLLDKPDMSKYVFCEVLDDCGQVPDGPDGQTADLRGGDMMVIKYTTVQHLVEAGRVALL